MQQPRELFHGTCVAFGDLAALIRGPSGAGKSDLALRCLALAGEPAHAPALVADDQVYVSRGKDGAAIASPPERLAGKLEVRGLGIVETSFLPQARLVLICDLVPEERVPRMPPERLAEASLGPVQLPVIELAAFHASTPMKLKLAVLAAAANSAA